MIPSTVNGKPVKNLGWLLRNWKSVESFTINPHPKEEGQWQADCHLIAHLKGGGTYETGFASAQILKNWLNRPVFRDVPQNWEKFILNVIQGAINNPEKWLTNVPAHHLSKPANIRLAAIVCLRKLAKENEIFKTHFKVKEYLDLETANNFVKTHFNI